MLCDKLSCDVPGQHGQRLPRRIGRLGTAKAVKLAVKQFCLDSLRDVRGAMPGKTFHLEFGGDFVDRPDSPARQKKVEEVQKQQAGNDECNAAASRDGICGQRVFGYRSGRGHGARGCRGITAQAMRARETSSNSSSCTATQGKPFERSTGTEACGHVSLMPQITTSLKTRATHCFGPGLRAAVARLFRGGDFFQW